MSGLTIQASCFKETDIYGRLCDCFLGLEHLRFRSFCFLCSVPVRQCCCVWASLRVPGGFPGASVSVVCALRGSLSRPRWVPCCCICGWCLGSTGCGVMCVMVRCMCSGLAGGLPFVARVGLLACVGGLAFIVCLCLWWFPTPVPACLCIPNHRVSL